VGRGPGSGRGKTSGRTQKGLKARRKIKSWFEGGQTPITKLFPKIGFRSQVPKPEFINLSDIQRLIDIGRLDSSRPIIMRKLYQTRFSSNLDGGIKILAGTTKNLLPRSIFRLPVQPRVSLIELNSWEVVIELNIMHHWG